MVWYEDEAAAAEDSRDERVAVWYDTLGAAGRFRRATKYETGWYGMVWRRVSGDEKVAAWYELVRSAGVNLESVCSQAAW